MTALPKPRGILFDRGGVLVQSRPSKDLRPPFVRFADWLGATYGIDSSKWITAMQGPNQGYDLGRLTATERLQRIAAAYGWELPDKEVPRIIRAEYNAYYTVCRLDSGIDTVRLLKQRGLAVGLCSNASPNEEGGDALLGLHTYLPESGYSHHLRVKKPDPEAYQRAAALLGFTDLSQLWFIDDGGDGSLQGATEAGLTAIYYEHPEASGAQRPDLIEGFTGPVIHDLRDLLILLDQAA